MTPDLTVPVAARWPEYWPAACAQLRQTDPVLAGMMDAYAAGPGLTSRGDAFQTLVRAIIGQQVSVKAAEAITARLLLQCPVLSPPAVQNLAEETLRACGLSRQKIRYLHGLAAAFLEGRVHPGRWPTMEEEAVLAELISLHGIGRWTAEMFLIFHLHRPDVWPVADIGLQKAVRQHYLPEAPVAQAPLQAMLRTYGERWRPWRTVATWYLWRSLDPVPVAY